MNLDNIKSITELREESEGNTRMLYHLNFWDGPISGVILWNGDRRYFNQIDEIYTKTELSESEWEDVKEVFKKHGLEATEDDRYDHESHRIYNVYELPEEAMEIIEENHELFRKYVGTHTDYDMDGKRGRGASIPTKGEPTDLGDLKPYSEHGNFYNNKERRSAKFKLDECKVVGTFKR